MYSDVSELDFEETTLDRANLPWGLLQSEADLYGGERWYRLQARNPAYEPGLVVARNPLGHVVGAVSTWAPRINGLDTYGRKLLESAGRHLSPRSVVYLGSVGGFRAAPNILSTLDGRARSIVRYALMTAAAQYSEARGRTAVVPYSLEDASSPLFDRGLLSTEASIAVEGGFDDWLSKLSKNRRSSVRRERRAVLDLGYRVEMRQLGEVIPRCAELLSNTQRKYGRSAEPTVLNRHLTRIHEIYDDDAFAFVAVREGQIDSVAVVLAEGSKLFLRAAGSAIAENGFLYFNTAVYAPIEYAARRRCTHVHLGTGSIAAKTNRGAIARELYMDIARQAD